MQNLTHVHIGAGKLGLGFVIPISKKCGFSVVVINDEKNKLKIGKLSAKKFLHKTAENETVVQFDNFFTYDQEMNETIVNAASDSSVRLLTTAVGEINLEYVAKSISKIIRRRRENGVERNLYVFACENLKGNSGVLRKYVLKHLREDDIAYVKSHVFFCDSIVDRVCWELDEKSDDLVTVSTHSFYKWRINVTGLNEEDVKFLDETLTKKDDYVKLVSSSKEFKLKEDLKLCCFNGMHLILAIYAKHYALERYQLQDFSLAKALQINSIGDAINRLQRVMTAGILQVHRTSEKKIEEYHEEFSRRMLSEPEDTANRIVHDLLDSIEQNSMKDLSVFLEKIHERINLPFQLAVDNKDEYVPNDLWRECTVMYSVLISVILSEMTTRKK